MGLISLFSHFFGCCWWRSDQHSSSRLVSVGPASVCSGQLFSSLAWCSKGGGCCRFSLEYSVGTAVRNNWRCRLFSHLAACAARCHGEHCRKNTVETKKKKKDFGKFSPISRFAGVSLCLECQSPIPRGLNPVSVQFVRVPVRGEKKMFVCYVMLYFVMLCYVMLYFVMLWYVLFVCLFCFVMFFLCYVMLCNVLFCFVCLFVILFGFDDWQGIDEKLSGLLFSFQDSLVA